MASLVLLISALLHREDANLLAAADEDRFPTRKGSSWSDQKNVFVRRNGADTEDKRAMYVTREDFELVEDPLAAKFCVDSIWP